MLLSLYFQKHPDIHCCKFTAEVSVHISIWIKDKQITTRKNKEGGERRGEERRGEERRGEERRREEGEGEGEEEEEEGTKLSVIRYCNSDHMCFRLTKVALRHAFIRVLVETQNCWYDTSTLLASEGLFNNISKCNYVDERNEKKDITVDISEFSMRRSSNK